MPVTPRGSSCEPVRKAGYRHSAMPVEGTSAIEDKLDLLIGLMRVAYREPLRAERDRILSDPVSKAILFATEGDWVDAGELKRIAAAKCKVSKPTAERRIAELLADGTLLRVGSGPRVRYRSSGLIGA